MEPIAIISIFVLAVFVGFEVVSKVSSTLHTPLMSGANAIHGVILVGAIIVASHSETNLELGLSVAAIILATINMIGGFVVTDRRLEMFKGKKSEKKDPEPHSDSKSSKIEDSHLDAGTTVLHAFQNLNPEQVLQMRDDTKELMETHKQLVETLSSLGPQVQQGAELVESFKGMFGGNLTEVLKQ
jgi:NAD(P) transhydrogenase subunit alpha